MLLLIDLMADDNDITGLRELIAHWEGDLRQGGYRWYAQQKLQRLAGDRVMADENWDDPKWLVGHKNEVEHCAICYAQGPDVWGIEGHQLTLCQGCRIRWRRGLGYPDYDS